VSELTLAGTYFHNFRETIMPIAHFSAIAITLFIAALVPSANAQTKEQDHPLVSRFPGSEIKEYSLKEFDEFTIPVGPYRKGKFTAVQKLEGKVTRIRYVNPANRSTLEIVRNYEQALQKAGFQIVFSCGAEDCADSGTLTQVPGFEMWCVNVGIQCPEAMRYVVGKLTRDKENVYVAAKVLNNAGPRADTVLYVIELKPMQTGMVTVNAQALAEDITKTGHVAIYGIYFDTAKAVIKPESKPVINEIGKLLKSQAALKLHVVGHTDNAGNLATNMTLSKQRAEAVVNAVVSEHGIAAGRLIANGVGPLAPVASNGAEDGRARNRRVELVAQ
jgi:outer membrane protein OmpA-like peptidoglycan-associated protein